MVYFNKIRWFFAILVFLGLFAFIQADDIASFAVALGVSYFIAYFVTSALKKHLFKPIILFDIHGVFLEGDFSVEDFTEKPGTRKLIRDLRNNYTVAAFTNMSPETFKLWSGKWNFHAMFDYVYYAGQFGIKKPEERVYKMVLRELGVKPKDVIFFDDREDNVASAKKVGLRAIVFKNARQARDALEAMGLRT